MKVFAAAVMVAMLVAPAALAQPGIAGSFQGWAPNDPNYRMTLDGNGVWTLTKTLSDTSVQYYKAVEDTTWSYSFPSNNQSFKLPGETEVTWYANMGLVIGSIDGDEFVFHSMNPPIACGDFMSELGGSDWDVGDTSTTVMSDPEGDGVWAFSAVIAPAGDYNFKVALNNNWDQSTGNDIPFHSDGVNTTTFTYDMATNTSNVLSAAAPTVLYARCPADCPIDTDIIEVKFSKDVNEVTSENTANYAVTGDMTPYTLDSATRDDVDHSVVYLDVNPAMVEGKDYQVVVTGVTDTDGIPVDVNNNDACFYLEKIVFEINMHIYVDDFGTPTSVDIQGDTYPLTWDICGGCEALDDGMGADETSGDTTYTVTEYFSLIYDCEASAETTLVKYKYVTDCTNWEGVYSFGHYDTLRPDVAAETLNVWWNDEAPQDLIECDVGVRFQVKYAPACTLLQVRGTEAPLDWDTGIEMNDDGENGDLTADDGIYSALVVFPTGTNRYLNYKYVCEGAFECDTYPDRELELDDVNGCMPTREGPMEFVDLYDWCEPVTAIENEFKASWGQIKNIYRVRK